MKTIPLTQGKHALVDDVDYAWAMQWKWQASTSKTNKNYYATRVFGKRGKQKHLRMSVELMKRHGLYVQGLQVDHIDRNSLNNQLSNLRMVTNRQNCENRSDNTNGYPGVYYHRSSGKWNGRAQIHGVRKYTRYYNTPQEAQSARQIMIANG